MPFVGNAGRFTHVYLAEVNQDNTKSTTSTPPTSINYNFSEITIGKDAGKTSQGEKSIAIGYRAGNSSQGTQSIALGEECGEVGQNTQSVALGYRSGQSIQGVQSVAIGYEAGHTGQNAECVAIGYRAGHQGQGASAYHPDFEVSWQENFYLGFMGKSVAIGNGCGEIDQHYRCVAIGVDAGKTSQGYSPSDDLRNRKGDAVAVGFGAGWRSQGYLSTAIGYHAGQFDQGQSCVAVGSVAGRYLQGSHSVAIGNGAAFGSQGTQSVAIGSDSGGGNQGNSCVAVGNESGLFDQGNSSVAMGHRAAMFYQGGSSVAMGYQAAMFYQGGSSVALGYYAGYSSQGGSSVALGYRAGYSNQHTKTIVINATGGNLNSTGTERFYVKPIGSTTGGSALYWNSGTGEIHTSSSDDRVKVNEVHIENATDTLLKLKPQNYDKLEDIGSSNVIGHESGLMAQDIWYDAPELRHVVVLGEGAEPTEEKPVAPSDNPQDDPDYSAWGSNASSVNYTQLVPYLVRSIQELKSEIELLKQNP